MRLDDTVRDLAPRLLRFSLGQTGDAALAEEAAQEALTALVQRWRKQGPPECPEAFAFAIARRRAFRLSLKRRLLAPLQVLFDRPSPEPSPEEVTTSRDGHRQLLAALRRLAPADREALLLVGVEGMELSRGAEILGISLSAIKMRVHRARKRLTRILEETGMTPPDEPGTPGDALFDQRLREALSPPPEQTERIVLRALNNADATRRVRAPRLHRLVPAGSMVALLAAAAIFFSLQLGRPRQSAVVSIVSLDGMVIATSEDEARPLVLSGDGERQSSGIILIRHGDPQ